jgi:hypothetical protein
MVGVERKELQDSVEDLQCVPARKLGMDRFPRAEAFGKVSPRDPCFGDVKDRVHECAVGNLCGSRSTSSLCRQQGFDTLPLLVAQFMPVHLQT